MTSLEKVISFPSNSTKLKCCLPQKSIIFNTGVRKPGASPGFGGIEGDMLQILVDMLPLNCDYYIPSQRSVGSRDPAKSTFSGCEGMLQRKEVDISLSSLGMSDTFSFAHTSISYRSEKLRFVTKLPDSETRPEMIIKAFDIYLWITILMSIFVISFIFYWIQGRRFSFGDQCFSRIAEFLLQEPIAKITGAKLSQELLCLFWTVGTMFLALAYTAVILGIMMAPKRPPSVDTDEKLLEEVKLGKYKIAIPADTPSMVVVMAVSPLNRYQELANFIREKKWLMEIDSNNFVPLLQKHYAIGTTSSSRTYFSPPGFDVVISKDYIYISNMCVMTYKSCPLKKKLDDIMARLIEHGIYKRQYDLYMFKERYKLIQKSMFDAPPVKPLSLTNLYGLFLLLGIGLGVSVIAFFFEILVLNVRKQIVKNKVMEFKTDSPNKFPDFRN